MIVMKKFIFILICIFLSFEVQSRTDWIKKDLCIEKKEEINECQNVGKDLYRYNNYMKKNLRLGKIVGVVYIKKGKDRGNNQEIIAKVSGYYYLVDDSVNAGWFSTLASDPELSVK